MVTNKIKVNYKNKKKGCFKKSLPSFLGISLCLIVGIVLFLEQLIPGLYELQKYSVLVDELEISVTDNDMSNNKITDENIIDFEQFINNNIINNESNPLFDENHNFIATNTQPETITILNSTIELDNIKLACFLNSCLGANWIPDLYIENKSCLSILEISKLQTENNETTISAICKINVRTLIKSLNSSEQNIIKVIDAIPQNVYFIYTATFANNTIKQSNMQINKLSEQSNDLLINILFNDNKTSTSIMNNLNSIIEYVLNSLDELQQKWNLSATFTENSLMFTKNTI